MLRQHKGHMVSQVPSLPAPGQLPVEHQYPMITALADTHITIKISQLCLFLENDTPKQSAGILLGLTLMKQQVWLNHSDMSAGCAHHCMHASTRLCHPVLL